MTTLKIEDRDKVMALRDRIAAIIQILVKHEHDDPLVQLPIVTAALNEIAEVQKGIMELHTGDAEYNKLFEPILDCLEIADNELHFCVKDIFEIAKARGMLGDG